MFLHPPKILMKDVNSPISIRFKFSCPDGHLCEPCMLKSKGTVTPRPICPVESREFIFIDSLLHFASSLGNCVDDLHNVASQENIPLEKMFSSVYDFSINHCKYTYSQFLALVKGKLHFPFNFATDLQTLKETTSVPSREAFSDQLSDNQQIPLSQYQHFISLWDTLQFKSLLECLWIYNQADTLFLLDAAKYYFLYIFEALDLFPGHFLTMAATAMSMALFHSRDPRDKNRSLQIDFVPPETMDIWQRSLRGMSSLTMFHFLLINSFFPNHLF